MTIRYQLHMGLSQYIHNGIYFDDLQLFTKFSLRITPKGVVGEDFKGALIADTACVGGGSVQNVLIGACA